MNIRCSRRRKKSTDGVERSNGYIEASSRRRRRKRYEEKVERETIKDIADIKVTEEENENNKRIMIEINIAQKVSVSELKHLLLEHIETIGTEKSELPKKVIFNTLVSKHK